MPARKAPSREQVLAEVLRFGQATLGSGFEFRIAGVPASRPGDMLWGLTGARWLPRRQVLVLELFCMQPENREELELHRPQGVSLRGKALTVRKVSRLVWRTQAGVSTVDGPWRTRAPALVMS